MNIGVDARPLTYRLTGIGVYLKHLLDELQKIDRENCYYLISNGPIYYVLKNPNWCKIEGKWRKKLLSTFWMQCQAPLLASKLRLDLFWGPRHHFPIFLTGKIKTVLTIHDIVHILYPETMSLAHLLVERLLMRWSALKADRIITVSSSTASGIQKAYGLSLGKIRVIHSGVPVLVNNTALDGWRYKGLPRQYFLFVGTLEPRKNFERVFKAFELMQPERCGVHLVIVGGRGWKNKGFLHKLKTHPLNHHIHLIGYVDSDQLLTFYTNALCLLFPSLYEGFGLPILEAMSCGTPVITSNISSMPEVAGDAALLVNPYDVDALMEAMQKILTNEKLRELLVMKGFERVKRYSWKRCAKQTLEVFNMLGNR